MEQVHEYENLVANLLLEGMKMCEVLQANVLIEKLSESWSDYRNRLKHKKRDMGLHELINHMQIEEANQLKDKTPFPKSELSVKANVVETSIKDDRSKGTGFQKRTQGQGHKHNNNKKGKLNNTDRIHKKPKRACFVCGKTGHRAYQCYHRKDGQKGGQSNNQDRPKNQANLAEEGDVVVAVVSEVNLIANTTEWIVDTGASQHFCANK